LDWGKNEVKKRGEKTKASIKDTPENLGRGITEERTSHWRGEL